MLQNPFSFSKRKIAIIISEIEFAFRYCTGKIITPSQVPMAKRQPRISRITFWWRQDWMRSKSAMWVYLFCRSPLLERISIMWLKVSKFSTWHNGPISTGYCRHTEYYTGSSGSLWSWYGPPRPAKIPYYQNQHKENHLILYRDAGIERYVPSMVLDGPQIHWVITTMDDSENVSINGETDSNYNTPGSKEGTTQWICLCGSRLFSGYYQMRSFQRAQSIHFVNDAHRLELIDVINGVQYVNDSKGDQCWFCFGHLDAIVQASSGSQVDRTKAMIIRSLIQSLVKTKVRALIASVKITAKLLQHYKASYRYSTRTPWRMRVRIGRQQH